MCFSCPSLHDTNIYQKNLPQLILPLTSEICFSFWYSNIYFLGGLLFHQKTLMQCMIANSHLREREISDFWTLHLFIYISKLHVHSMDFEPTISSSILFLWEKDASFELEITGKTLRLCKTIRYPLSSSILANKVDQFNPHTISIYELFLINSAWFRYNQTNQIERLRER